MYSRPANILSIFPNTDEYKYGTFTLKTVHFLIFRWEKKLTHEKMKSHHGKLTNALVIMNNAWVRIWIWCGLFSF